jgi:hypothetical protein
VRHPSGLLLLLLPMAGSALVRADEAGEARALVEKAIRAMGGQDRLNRLKGITWKGQGTAHVEDKKFSLRDERAAREVDRWRWKLDAEVDGGAFSLLLVFNRDRSWIQANGREAKQLPPDLHETLQHAARIVRLAERPNLLLDRGCKLSPLGELRINDRDAVGVKVVVEGQPDLDLFFDKKTSLPLRAEIRVKEKKDSAEVQYSFYFDDYKKFGDVMHFTKASYRREDKVHLELELEEVKLSDTLDDSTFDKP